MFSTNSPGSFSPQTLTLITAVDPGRCDYLGETAESVKTARVAVEACGWLLEWVVIFDGPTKTIIDYGADAVESLSKHSGIAQARNVGLGITTGAWVMPLDADDLLNAEGLTSVLRRVATQSQEVGWVAVNRTLMDGSKTLHWNTEFRKWNIGDLASTWSSPFPFHPNSVLARRDMALRVGGWPALPANEDMAWSLLLSEVAEGVLFTDVVLFYRTWDGQEVSRAGYLHDKSLSFRAIEGMINAVREPFGRTLIQSPGAGGAFGVMSQP